MTLDLSTGDPTTPAPFSPGGDSTLPGDPGGYFSIQDVLYLAPGLPAALAQIVLDEWVRTGSWEIAIGAMRASDLYDTFFPGNRREDGSLRYDESTYLAMIEGFQGIVADRGINPDLFGNEYIQLISGGVSIGEFSSRLDTLATRVLVMSDEMRAHFAAEIGVGLSDEAMIAALMSPDLNDALLSRQITEAEILTEATLRGFDADALDERLFDFGFTRERAAELFGAAQEALPLLDILVARHNDPDQDFSLEEFVDAMAFGNRTQRLRYRRLLAQEASLFSGGLSIASDQTGALTGLTAR